MKIITDTGSLYSPEEGRKIGIDVLPLNVMVDHKKLSGICRYSKFRIY